MKFERVIMKSIVHVFFTELKQKESTQGDTIASRRDSAT